VTAQTQRDALDALVRRIQQTPGEHSPELASALEAGRLANDTGIDVAPALEGLQALWREPDAVSAPAPEPDAAPPDAPPEEL